MADRRVLAEEVVEDVDSAQVYDPHTDQLLATIEDGYVSVIRTQIGSREDEGMEWQDLNKQAFLTGIADADSVANLHRYMLEGELARRPLVVAVDFEGEAVRWNAYPVTLTSPIRLKFSGDPKKVT